MELMRFRGPFRALAVVAIALLAPQGPASPVHGEIAAHAAAPSQPQQQPPSVPDAKPDTKTPASPSNSAAAPSSAVTIDHGGPPQPKSLTAKAIDKVKDVAKSASDIFSRVPCMPPKGGLQSLGSLPRVANRLVAGQPVVIV